MDDNWITVLLAVLTALGVGGVFGTVATQLLTGRRDKAKRELEFSTRQIQGLYGPLLSLREEIRAHSELHLKLQRAIDQSREEAIREFQLRNAQASPINYLDPIFKNINDKNDTFRSLILPRYHEMVNTFKDKMWLLSRLQENISRS
jgi:hypothetical protein